jgi:hypothetical protein
MNTEEFKLTRRRFQKENSEFFNKIYNLIKHCEAVEQKSQKQYDDGYQKGFEDAWELARKIIISPSEGNGMNYDDIVQCFGEFSYAKLLRSPAYEVKEKYDAWKEKKKQEEQEDDEIHVGDEVRWNNMYEFMVVVKKVNDHYGLIHLSDGSYDNSDGCHLVKTGKHYDLHWLQEEK